MENDSLGFGALKSLISHVFLPLQLPQQAQEPADERATSLLLCRLLKDSALEYQASVAGEKRGQWDVILSMLNNVENFVNVPMSPSRLATTFRDMAATDVLALHVRAQNAAIIVRKRDADVVFEVFEASSSNEVIYSTPGKILVSYPGPAVSVPADFCSTLGFRDNFALFVSSMDVDVLDSAPETTKAGSTVQEVRDTADPKYISQLLIGILHGCPGSSNPDVRRITKHIADEVMWSNAYMPWRRLPLWLILRVALQTTLATEIDYKSFMLLFMTRVLSLCVKDESSDRAYSSDLLFTIRSKVARRFAKLSDSTPPFVQAAVTTVGDRIQVILEQRWAAVQASQSQSAPWNPPSMEQVESDTKLSLTTSSVYLQTALEQNAPASERSVLSPSHPERLLGTEDFNAFADGRLSSALTRDFPRLVLSDFEESVQRHLDDWVSGFALGNRTAASETLLSCFEQYQEGSRKHYELEHPEDMSIAALTLLALWSALDRVAILEHPLLDQYSPEIPVDLLEPLILRDQPNVRLAGELEVYIRGRHARASPGAISLFETSSSGTSFALRTFDERAGLQILKGDIESYATRKRQEKREELQRLNTEYHTLKSQCSALSCNTVTSYRHYGGQKHRYEEHYRWGCERCKREDKADSLRIDLHEWPLPSNDQLARMVVFELACPPIFSRWREMTYRVLTSVGKLGSAQDGADPYTTLKAYSDLSRYHTARPSPLVLASDTKPFINAHYSQTKIPASESQVCVNNGLTPYLFHSDDRVQLSSDPFTSSSFIHFCSPALDSESPYHHLQAALDFTTHTSNEILADQASCPKDLSLSEHIAFASMRSGGRLQWLNVLRELHARTLTFNAPDVHRLLSQAIWQVGPLVSGDTRREWHLELDDLPFCTAILAELQALLESIGENWKEITTVRTIVVIALRVLEACPHDTAQKEARGVLCEARKLAALFRNNLHERLRSVSEEGRPVAQRLVCEAAAVCAMTFDVPDGHLLLMLGSSSGVYELVRSLILVQENSPLQTLKAPLHVQLLLRRHERVARRVEARLRSRVLANPEGMHRAITSLWSTYTSDGPWVALGTPNERQLTRTLSSTGQIVHLDILSGLFLVDGRPLGRLPSSVTTHPTFRRLLGETILDVIPATDPGMEYETRESISDAGWTLSFAMRADNRLIIRARLDEAELEFIPHETFRGDVPNFLVDDCAHWMDLATGYIDFRPLEYCWVLNKDNWHLSGLAMGHPTLTRKLGDSTAQKLVDPRSATFRAVNNCLGALEISGFLILSLKGNILSAELPRFRLSFFMNTFRQLQSSSFANMVVDEDQSHGTFFGLRNQLVLRAKDQDARTLPRSRRVVIPDGEVSFQSPIDHAITSIQVSSNATRITYHTFVIDNDLRRLSATSDTTSLLFQSLLHALTSGCLPDPLTGHTGTEQALSDLCGARIKSFTRLSTRDLTLLHDIASLSTPRAFYPSHLSVMQQVAWLDLPSLSQHAGFKLAVDKILAFAQDLDLFQDRARNSTQNSLNWEIATVQRDSRLTERSLRHLSLLYGPDCSAALKAECRQPDPRHSPILPTPAAAELFIAELSRELQSSALSAKTSDHDVLSMLEKYQHIGIDRNLTLSYSSLWLRPELIGANWLALYDHCVKFMDSRVHGNRIQLVFSLCSLAFARQELRSTAKVILALCLNEGLYAETAPMHTALDLSDGYAPVASIVEGFISGQERGWRNTPAVFLPSDPDESMYAYERRQHRYHGQMLQDARVRLVTALIGRWPRTDVHNVVLNSIDDWIHVDPIIEETEAYFQSCSRNSAFADHIRRVQTVLSTGNIVSLAIERLPALRPTSLSLLSYRTNVTDTLLSLLSNRNPPSVLSEYPDIRAITTAPQNQTFVAHTQEIGRDLSDVSALLRSLSSNSTSDGIVKAYLNGLRDSIAHLSTSSSLSIPQSDELPMMCVLQAERDARAACVKSLFDEICVVLLPHSAVERQLHTSGLWPRVTERDLLHTMRLEQRSHVSDAWMGCVTLYGRHVLAYQRSQRLLEYGLRGQREEFVKEIQNSSLEDGTDHDAQPDWLLIQIESSFLARTVQRSVAYEMISPSPLDNSLQQLNMGEGKSSVIVPFIATALARGDNLVRVVVLKALSGQMYNLLADRLSGLAGRQVLCIPFSRGVSVSQELLLKMDALYNECARTGGVLVVQPEHILSFKLMAIDYLTSSSAAQQGESAQLLWKLQQWVTGHTRDILDESDELLHARYQLIYTVGLQQPVENHPFRWTIIQQVLLLLKDCLEAMAASHPHDIIFIPKSYSRFPHIRILTSDVDEKLTGALVDRVMDGGVPDLHFSALRAETRSTIADFIISSDLSDHTHAVVRRELAEGDWKGVLLLRGLLALGTGVLLYVLKQRRWRVDFGLDPTRSLLAVPYRAKDVPSLKAEFGHPDVAITLTCLSYYYGGLTAEQVMQCFARLFKMDDPRREYAEWVGVGGADVPGVVRELSGINLEDEKLVKTVLIPTFSHNYAIVNFFLAHVVFPREAKEFPHKLGTSAWDLAEHKTHVTTGFSGTKDGRFLLPTSISQKDPPEQRGTDALVLSHMLQPENTYAARTGDQSGKDYLQFITSQRPEIRVLLDVGAQMLDMRNHDIALYWLKLCNESIQAAVYFSEADDLVVLSRDGVVERLRSSSFNEQLDKCIVYLDDVHTRGTDLKLPKNYRAALTVGPKVTKDRLVQGAMRMRKLGYGQSVLILAPGEIDRRIRRVAQLDTNAVVEVRHALQWTMLETCADIAQHIPHWAEQGVDHERRRQGLAMYTEGSNVGVIRDSWLQPEARTLDQMYGVTVSAHETHELWDNVQTHDTLMAHLATMNVKSTGSARLSEEQEREVVLEVERERQVERPPKQEPAVHRLHRDVLAFARSGQLPSSSSQFISLFTPVQRAGDAWDPRLLATRDFAVALANSSSLSTLHDYLRPVAWVLSSGDQDRPDGMRLVVISPFEANELLPILRTSTSGVHLHIYTPRLVKSMPSLSDLRFHIIPVLPASTWSVPQSLQLQLALWSGELWIKDYASYKLLCVLLGLYMGYTADEIHRLRDGGHIASDGSVRHSGRALVAVPSRFSDSPVERLRELFGLRRKGVAYLSTHMGQILTARELEESAFDVPS
ncbi:hypothetical protein PENSPDRAFT_754324 [Peniophora sp. CONT]|nr:hypothetical protein PENSPDRAFT_754324 [Peniophora sp. CONT]